MNADVDDDTWNTAFHPEAQNVTPVKKRRSSVKESGAKTSSKRTKSSVKTPKRSSIRKSKQSKSSSQKKKKNVFDGLTQEFESELQRPISDGDVASSEDELQVKGEEIILIVQNSDQNRVHVSTTTEAPFRHLFEKYRTHATSKGWIEEKTKLKFFFDDTLLDENDTPVSFDCQADDIIDVTAFSAV